MKGDITQSKQLEKKSKKGKCRVLEYIEYGIRISAFNVNFCLFSTNCNVWIIQLKILLPVHPQSIAF